MRTPFEPPYTKDDLEDLDFLHTYLGLGLEWFASESRKTIEEGGELTEETEFIKAYRDTERRMVIGNAVQAKGGFRKKRKGFRPMHVVMDEIIKEVGETDG